MAVNIHFRRGRYFLEDLRLASQIYSDNNVLKYFRMFSVELNKL